MTFTQTQIITVSLIVQLNIFVFVCLSYTKKGKVEEKCPCIYRSINFVDIILASPVLYSLMIRWELGATVGYNRSTPPVPQSPGSYLHRFIFDSAVNFGQVFWTFDLEVDKRLLKATNSATVFSVQVGSTNAGLWINEMDIHAGKY